MSINFKEVELPKKDLNFVKPGFWKMYPTKAELITSKKGTPAMNITFESENGKLVDKFWITTAAANKIQYLHNALYNKTLDKEFESNEDLVNYFNKAFKAKKIELNLAVGGEMDERGRIFAKLKPGNFVIPSENFEEGSFEEGSARWKEMVKISSYSAPSHDNPIVSDDPKNGEDDFPF